MRMKKQVVLLAVVIAVCGMFPLASVTAQTSMPRHAAGAIAWKPDNTRIALGYGTGMIRIFDPSSGSLVKEIQAYEGPVTGLDWGPDNTPYEEQLLSGGVSTTVYIWDTLAGTDLKSFEVDEEYVSAVAWRPDGSQVLATTTEGGEPPYVMNVWDTVSGKLLYSPSHTFVSMMKWSPNHQHLASTLLDGRVTLWDLTTYQDTVVGTRSDRDKGTENTVQAVAWSPDSQLLAFGKWNGEVEVWEPFPTSHRVLDPLQANDLGGDDWFLSSVVDLSFSPDGQRLQAISGEGTIRVWEVATGNVISSVYLNKTIYNAAWNSDGSQLVYNSEDEPFRILTEWQSQ